MKSEPKPVMIIPREKAVFRLDKNGVWHSNDGKFTNQKIIDYFHSIIKKDKGGYYLEQEHSHYIEKVYFPFEDTPLFVVDIIKRGGLSLCLNTGESIDLDPEKLFVKNGNLFIRKGEDIIKFTENPLVSLADCMDEMDDQYVISISGKRHVIPVVK